MVGHQLEPALVEGAPVIDEGFAVYSALGVVEKTHGREERATAKVTTAGTWQVTLDVRARKLVVDTAGVETDAPMHEWVELGVFAEAGRGSGQLSEPLYVQRHRIRSGTQTITATVARKPTLVGIDPYHVLDWEEREDDNNLARVKIEGAGR